VPEEEGDDFKDLAKQEGRLKKQLKRRITEMMKKKKQAEIKEDKALKNKDLKIQNDIFSLAFAAFIDASKTEQGNGYLSDIILTSR